MPRIIFKCPYLKPDQHRSAAHRGNYVRYVATREGVDHLDPGKAALPATERQKEMVNRLLRDFPLCRGLFEYEDYLASPTRGNATEFITRAIEDNADSLAKRENYVDYIARRPRAERTGSHGLFTGTDNPLVLSQVAEAVANHPGNVWLPIISLRREDAARLGYDSAARWKDLLTSYAPQIAEAMKIPLSQFHWYAAFHDESHHPHIHMVCYSADGKSGFLDREGIAQIKSGLAKEIFHQDLTEIYRRQTQQRDVLTQESQDTLRQLIDQMRTGTLANPNIERLMLDLSERLRNTSGKKQYGYLKAPLKAIVDGIVDELEKDPRVAAAYELWYQSREEVLRTYKDDLSERLPLSRQKEFKRIKNTVIEEAVHLGQEDAVLSPKDTEEPIHSDNGPAPEELAPGNEQPKLHDEAPPTVVWSRRYKEARKFMTGDDENPPDFEKARLLLLEEARSGNALAMFDLGKLFGNGLGQDPDERQAQMWYAKALAAFQAVERERPNRYVEYRIGKMFAAGIGTEQDYEVAAQWLTRSAEQDYTYAQYSLAKLYREGWGVEQNYKTALQLYEQAAVKDFPYAAWELGKLYRDGVGSRPNEHKAARYFAAAFRGFKFLEKQSHDDKLQYRLGWILLHGVGAERDESAARKWFEKSARSGNEHAQYQLSKLILDSAGSTPEEISQAVEWLTKLAEAGSQYAQYALGKLYRDGGPMESNAVQAVIWFSQAAGQGHEYAMYALGKLNLEAGNASAARRWFEKAANLGNQFAQYQLGKLLLQGDGVSKDVEEAVRQFTASAEQGNQFAQYALGKLYLLGKDILQDRDAAVHWFTLAAEQGNEYAQYFLDHMNDPQGPPLLTNATQLLHHMSRIFRDEAPPSLPGINFVDSKLRRRIREKKIAMGHKPDDHEDQGIAMR